MRLSHFNLTQVRIQDMFITAIHAMLQQRIPGDSKLPPVKDDDIWAMLKNWNAHLFFYDGISQTSYNKVQPIKAFRELSKAYSESISFECYSEQLAIAFRSNVRNITVGDRVDNGYSDVTWDNHITLKEAKDVVDSYYEAICKYADDSNKLSES